MNSNCGQFIDVGMFTRIALGDAVMNTGIVTAIVVGDSVMYVVVGGVVSGVVCAVGTAVGWDVS